MFGDGAWGIRKGDSIAGRLEMITTMMEIHCGDGDDDDYDDDDKNDADVPLLVVINVAVQKNEEWYWCSE